MPQENLTTRESLDIITEMIQHAKGNVRDNSDYFLFWGIVIVVANLGVFTLIQWHYAHPYYVWIITVPAWVYTMYVGFTKRKKDRVVSHLGRITSWLWVSFGITVFVLVVFGKMINYQLNPVILIISAIPTLVSGIIIKFKPLVIGGISFWTLGILSFFVSPSWQSLLGAVAVTVGYLIPGFILRNKKENTEYA